MGEPVEGWGCYDLHGRVGGLSGGHYILYTAMRFFARSRGLWITVSVIVLLLGIEVGFSFWKWDWLRRIR